MSENAALLRIDNLTKSYDGKVNALEGASLEVGRGQFVSIIGSSGAGKSTLLRCINKLVNPTSGSIMFEGTEVTALRGRKLRELRRRVSMVFQNYNLVYRTTAIENVLQGRLGYKSSIAGALSLFTEDEKQRAFDMLERVGLADFAYTRTDQLSGGQKQRVGIARALVQEPALILADEPIASLDPRSSRDVMELLRWAVDDLGVSCLVSLHQVEYALEFSDYIYGLSKGHPCCQGVPSSFTPESLASVYADDADSERTDDPAQVAAGAPATSGVSVTSFAPAKKSPSRD